ncbi:hypothetical protein [Qipengyuania flava]|uniref:hypothetical protein n=1 Tax=Qipengyuania flava TaxID=192812 RepID=UPI00273EC700|nr:hypothetical protein [Qipengyuania flava]
MSSDSKPNAIEQTLRQSIESNFSVLARTISLADDGSDTLILELAETSSLAPVNSGNISRHVEGVFDALSRPLPTILLSIERLTPSSIEFLETIRIASPTMPNALHEHFVHKGFNSLTLSWVEHQLDRFRKRAFIARRDDNTYVMTLNGLNLLGSQRNRNSSDVKRVLEMARRGA